MSTAKLVLVDWGTTSFRLWLADGNGDVLAESRGREGMMHAAQVGFAAVLARHLAVVDAPAGLPVLVCGMAGARQGWMEAPYLDTPARLGELAAHAVCVTGEAADIRILPGIAHRDPDHPSVMRGEETQLLGLDAADALVCMPGTHCKWVCIEGGVVRAFSTFMTGELFDVLARHSILRHAVEGEGRPAAPDAAFRAAMAQASARPDAAWARLFALRPAQLLGLQESGEGASRLSGLLIGAEVGAARALHPGEQEVALVASGPVADLYRLALEENGWCVRSIDAEAATLAGLTAAARQRGTI